MCLIRKEFSLEGDGEAADHVDALLFDGRDAEMHLDQLIELVPDAVFWGELGEWEDAGVNDGHDLREDDLSICDVAVDRLGVEDDEVVDQHH